MLSVYSLLTNFLLLFVILVAIAGMYGIGRLEGQDLQLSHRSFTTSQLYTFLLCVTLPLGIFASPITTVLWLVGASFVTIGGHASFMEKPIESEFEEQV